MLAAINHPPSGGVVAGELWRYVARRDGTRCDGMQHTTRAHDRFPCERFGKHLITGRMGRVMRRSH